AGSPKELRLNVKGGPEATPVKSRSSSPSEPMDSHTVATLHLDSCHGCGMAPIIGCCYRCSTCSDFVFCSRCYEHHDQSHTLTVVSLAVNGIILLSNHLNCPVGIWDS
ncbi:hypothetical protein FOZ63_014268, partial [Perkinsus olseni]